MSRIVLAAAALAVAAGVVAPALAQTAADQAAKESQYPAPVNTFEIELGHKTDYREGGKNESYRRITYKGTLLKSEGTPFRQALGLDLAAPSLKAGAGDRNRLSLRYEDGSARVGGGLFEALGVMPLDLRLPKALELRGTAFAGGDADGKSVQLAVGLETAPFRVPGFRDSHWSNWIVFGVNAQRQDQTDAATGDTTFGLLTYRAFLGKSFGFRRIGDPAATSRKIAEQILSKLPTLESARPVAAAINANTKAGTLPNSVQQLIVDAVGEARSEAEWEKTVRALVTGDTHAAAEVPTLSLYAESSGWYSAAGAIEGSKFKNLLTVTLDYWFLPGREDMFLRARYENGYERATPTERKNRLLLSVGLKF